MTLWFFFLYNQRTYCKGARRLGYVTPTRNLKVTLWSLRRTQLTYLKGARRFGYLKHTRGLKVALWLFRHTQRTCLEGPDDWAILSTQEA